ncbi:MAG: hypothetical protein CL748_06060 [Chloroflexi bacterium]|nr:hypothetical protein [Chloroflexota bacterium]
MKEKIKKLVKSIPFLFNLYVNIFYYSQYLLHRYFIARRVKKSYLNKKVNFIKLPVKNNSFFGYYNISPFNNNGGLLWCETTEKKTRGSKDSSVNIVYYNSLSNNKKVVAKSKAWNWQQGCMLQWFGNSDHKIIYNNYNEKNNDYYSEIFDFQTNKRKSLCKPIYSVSNDGAFALTLNFDRYTMMRPSYGYFRKQNIVLPSDENDGIWFIDIEKNTSKLIISLDNLKKFEPDPTMVNSKHKVNHIDIAPDGKRFMFLHRWIGSQGRFHRLITANCRDGSDLFFLTGIELVSHNCWMTDSKNIISFSRLNDGRDRYNRYTDKKGFVETIGENDFFSDGHPSVSTDGRWILTDDYPDKSKFSRLYLYDLLNKKKHILGMFHQPYKYKGENRIDLHPKWSEDGKFVSIDSGHRGKREFHVINITKIIKK